MKTEFRIIHDLKTKTLRQECAPVVPVKGSSNQ